jgi:hypothetical protein
LQFLRIEFFMTNPLPGRLDDGIEVGLEDKDTSAAYPIDFL